MPNDMLLCQDSLSHRGHFLVFSQQSPERAVHTPHPSFHLVLRAAQRDSSLPLFHWDYPQSYCRPLEPNVKVVFWCTGISPPSLLEDCLRVPCLSTLRAGPSQGSDPSVSHLGTQEMIPAQPALLNFTSAILTKTTQLGLPPKPGHLSLSNFTFSSDLSETKSQM